ncbi:MAG: glycerophosphodiester phosphodiesterase [Clostridiaceae bacterium]|nr:glycerophosphodiester phosphodiesterase [Clostridiaceae bacterium]
MSYIVITVVVIGLIIIYLYFIAPDTTREMNTFKSWLYAHRGLHDLNAGIPENTIPAFEKAVEMKFGIELDVHISKDEQVIVFHDDTLKRACGVDKEVSSMTYDMLKTYNLFNTDTQIPLFKEVLDLVSGKVPIIIELKSCCNIEKLCTAVSNILDNYNGLYCIESFDPRIVKWFRINRSEVSRGQLSTSLYKSNLSLPVAFAITNLLTNVITRPHFIAYDFNSRQNLSFLICRKLFKANTVAWTIRNRNDLDKAKNLFDTFIFESFIPYSHQ